MVEPKKIYNSTITCPVCKQAFSVTKVRVGSYRVSSRDTDFAVNYEGINPMLYDPFVCEHCGYAALQDRFADIGPNDQKVIVANVAPHWKQQSFCGERTLDSALAAYKLVLHCSQLQKAKSSTIAKICLRIAWIYRWKEEPRETDFLQFALDFYSDAYQCENFPIDKMDESHCLYLVAELNRKLGNIDEATKWFGKLFNNNEARQNKGLWDLAHEQYQLIKDLKQEQES